MKKNVYVIWVESRLGHIDDDEEDMETEVQLYEIVDNLEKAQDEVLRLNKNNLDHWNIEFWYSEEPLISDTSRVSKEIYLTTPENYDYIMTLIDNNKKLGKEVERLNKLVHSLRESWLQEHQENIELQGKINKTIEGIKQQKLHKIQDTTGGLTYQEWQLLNMLEGGAKGWT